MISEKQLLDYLKQGIEVFPAIITLMETKKNIITPSGTSWKPPLTADQAVSWLHSLHGRANALCMKTGNCSGVTVIDDDNRDVINHQLARLIPLGTSQSRTGNGGRHFFFSYATGISTSANHEHKIDIRNDGGLIILPPSRFKGRGYAWITPFNRVALRPMPSDLKCFILNLRQPETVLKCNSTVMSYRQLSPKQRFILDGYIARSKQAEVGVDDRSGCDYALCCWAVKINLLEDDLWRLVQNIGKFEQRGWEYFNRTYRNALCNAR